MSFIFGFTKVAGFVDGLSESLNAPLKDTLKLKGLREAAASLKDYKKPLKNLVTTSEGLQHLGHNLGKSAPSIIAALAYKKAIDKLLRPKNSNQSEAIYVSDQYR